MIAIEVEIAADDHLLVKRDGRVRTVGEIVEGAKAVKGKRVSIAFTAADLARLRKIVKWLEEPGISAGEEVG